MTKKLKQILAPGETEDIEIKFILPSGTAVWWKAMVEEVHEKKRSLVGARHGHSQKASIVYEAGYGYEQQRETVVFHGGCRVQTGSCAENLATWRYHNNQHTREKSNRTRVLDQKKREENRCAAIGIVKTGFPHALEKRDENGAEIQSAHGKIEGNYMTAELVQRIGVLESKMSLISSCSNGVAIEERIAALKTRVKVDVIELLGRPIRKHVRGTNVCSHSRILERSSLYLQYDCDLKLFKYVVKSMKSANDVRNDVFVIPSLHDIEYPSMPLENVQAVFRTIHAMFRWLGIVVTGEDHDFIIKKSMNEQNQAFRILGGVQWSNDDAENPLHIFPGASCAMHGRNYETTEDERGTITMESMLWDDENDMFVCTPMLGTGTTGFNDDQWGLLHAFAVWWEKDCDACKRAVRYHEKGTTLGYEDVVLGTLKLSIPCAVGRGMRVCNALEECRKELNLHDLETPSGA